MKNHFLLAIAIIIAGIVVSCGSEPNSLDTPQTAPMETGFSDGDLAPSEASRSSVTNIRPFVITTPSKTVQPIPSLTNSPEPSRLPDTPTPIPEPAFPVYEGREVSPTNSGVQIHLHRENLEQIFSHLDMLGVGWVKVQVSWKLYEPEPGEFDDFRFDELDRLVSMARARDIRVLLSVAKAPEWSRPTTELDGPPMNFQLFETFMNKLASRYGDQVAAYELWNEPNLNREWNGVPLSATDLVELIRYGAAGVRAANQEALLISGAPATTGINDGLVAIDDRLFLKQMVAAGIVNMVDAIGAHPYGWANPPDSSAAAPELSIPSHNNHPSFFFVDTLQDYRQILLQSSRPDIPIWVTEFGWGSYEGLAKDPPAAVEYMAYVDEQQQASYTLRAYEMAQEMAGIGPLIIWNLNFAPTFGDDFVESAYSLLRPDGSRRPVFNSVTSMLNTE
jgi:hypothetical protein